jgi:predicted nucleotidyltransferase
METIVRKNRTRLSRGKLTSFYELPQEHQEGFLKIKKEICKCLGSDTNVYVFGSFFWGMWDEESDYDVLLDYIFNKGQIDERIEAVKKAKETIAKEYGFKVDIMAMRGEKGVLIP